MRLIVAFWLCALCLQAEELSLRDYGRLPLVFEPNQGQTDSEVKFLARTEGGTLFLTEREMVLAAPGSRPVRMRLAGSRKPEAIHGLEPTGGISNYIHVEYEGVESLRLDGDRDLVLKTTNGELRQKRPLAYQETAAGRVAVDVGYRLKGGRVAFELARYDTKQRLIIDPVLIYSTYLGGS